MKKRRRIAKKSVQRKLTIVHLPDCIIEHILSRLPLETIFRCRLVCKSFYDLSSCPSVANKCFATQTSYIVTRTCGPACALLKFPSQCLTDLRAVRLQYPENTFPIPKSGELKLVGSCNGLLCFMHRHLYDFDDKLFLANPLLGECVALPIPRTDAKVNGSAYAFTYCQSTRQYKVLRVVQRRFLTRRNTSRAEVLTIGIDREWRDLGDAPFPLHGNICTVTHHRSLHWIAEHPKYYNYICRFDIKEENFWSNPVPQPLRSIGFDDLKHLGVGVLDEQLYIVDNTAEFEVLTWLRGHKDGGSWTPRLQIELDYANIYDYGRQFFHPENDPFTSALGIQAYSSLFESFMYAPSLVCPKTVVEGSV